MASRRRAREFALQALFQADLREVTVTAALADLWGGLMDGEGMDDGRAPESEEVEFAQRLCIGVDERRAEIDTLIEECSTNWRLQRMPVVDRNVLRIAAFEVLACHDIPATVSINEAVELAKNFGGTDGFRYVNGVLDKVAAGLREAEVAARG